MSTTNISPRILTEKSGTVLLPSTIPGNETAPKVMPFRTVIQDMVDTFSPSSMVIDGVPRPSARHRFRSLPSQLNTTDPFSHSALGVWYKKHEAHPMYTNQDARNSVTSTSTAYYSALSSFSSIRQSRSYSDFRLTSDTFKQLATRTSQSRLGGRDIVASTPVLTPVIEDRKSTESQPDSVPPASPPTLRSIPILDDPETEKASETMVAVEHTSSSSNTSTSAPSDSTSYSQLTSTDMFRCLISHGCQDLRSQIDPDEYSSCRIAEGGFGDIWRGQMYDGMSIAVKVLRCGQVTVKADERKGLKRMMREIYAWSKLDHDNVHKLLGVTIFQGRLGMVSQWLPQGNLRDYLIRSPGVDRYELCTQLSQSVVYIHDRDMVGLLRYLDILAQRLTNRIGQVHGDLKALNILVSPNGVIKLTDFDYSIITNCSLLFTDTTRVGGGTYRWMAPELFVKEGYQRSKETDVYALGMTFLEIITGAPPYHPQCKNDAQVMYKVTTGTLPTRPSDHFAIDQQGNAMWQLLTHCWAFDPASRPKALEVLNSLPSRLHPQEYAQSDYTKPYRRINIAIRARYLATADVNKAWETIDID